MVRTKKGTRGDSYQSIYEPTEPSQAKMSDDVSDEDRPQHRELSHENEARLLCAGQSASTMANNR